MALTATVALHPEGVDRNSGVPSIILKIIAGSPSTRRAWIEIKIFGQLTEPLSSPSTRRAWIEM